MEPERKMYIYNVTTNVEEGVLEKWRSWMIEKHIPDVLATGKFLSAKMSKVLVEEELGGETFSVQFIVANKSLLQQYYKEDADRLRQEALNMFPGQLVSFRTEMEIINEQTAK